MRIIGLMVCGPNEADRYLEASLKELRRLCDDAIIALNNVDQKTRDLVKKYQFWHYDEPREWGKEQPNIKSDLLKKVGGLNPDWVIALDADEVFAPEFTRLKAEQLASLQEIAYHFLVVNLYDDPDHFVHGAGIQRFWNIRFFKFYPQHTTYQKKNVHCGLAPPIYYKYGWYAPYYLEHYGLMKKKDRMRKAERYKLYDPNARMMSQAYYDELKQDLTPQIFYRDRLLKKLEESNDCKPRDLCPAKLMST